MRDDPYAVPGDPPRLSAYRPDAPIFTSTQAVCQDRPSHALLAAQIIGQAAGLEAHLASMTAGLVDGRSKGAVALLGNTKADQLRQRAKAVAAATLDGDELRVFNGLLGRFKKLNDHRNRFAHSLWALSDAIDDGLLLISPETNHTFLVSVRRHLAEGQPDSSGLALDRSGIWVYRLSDMEALTGAYDFVRDGLSTLSVQLNPRPLHPAPELRWRLLVETLSR